MRLQELPEFVHVQFAIAEDFVQQAGADRFARMRGRNRVPAILMTKEVVAAFDSTEKPSFPSAATRSGPVTRGFRLMPLW
jgi:hypothetical protein